MLLTRIMPTSFGDLRHEVDRLFGDWAAPFNGCCAPTFPLNVWEDADRFCVEAELPGVTMQGIEVNVVGDELSIKGTRKAVCEDNCTYHHQERTTGEFARVVTLPTRVDASKVEAVFKDGVLSITLPKAEEAKPKRIQVKTSE